MLSFQAHNMFARYSVAHGAQIVCMQSVAAQVVSNCWR